MIDLEKHGRSRQLMIDRHDSARYALDVSGGLIKYVAVESFRVLARFLSRVKH